MVYNLHSYIYDSWFERALHRKVVLFHKQGLSHYHDNRICTAYLNMREKKGPGLLTIRPGMPTGPGEPISPCEKQRADIENNKV